MSWERRRLPAAVSPPFFLLGAVGIAFELARPFCLAQRALAAAAILERVAADIFRRPLVVERAAEEVPKIEARRFSRAAIWRRIPTASSNCPSDKSMRSHIAVVQFSARTSYASTKRLLNGGDLHLISRHRRHFAIG
jgi:hypothetical protein